MTLGDMAKIGITSFMTSTHIDEQFVGVTLLSDGCVVFQRSYDFHDFQNQSEIGGLHEFYVTLAVTEYKEVIYGTKH
jgi:hypothetical protein